MSFVQCVSRDEVEKVLVDLKQGFVTEDHRIYSKLRLEEAGCSFDLNAEVVIALMNLRFDLEMMSDGTFEQSFLEVEENAKMLRESFQRVVALIKPKSEKSHA